MPNPNELARLEDEREYWLENLNKGIHSKSTKEYILRQVHDRERQLGMPLTKYNGLAP